MLSIYVANIVLSSPEYLQTAFAQNAYERKCDGKDIIQSNKNRRF